MMPELGRIGSLVLRSYTVLLDLAILMGLGVMTWRGWRSEDRHSLWLDAGLVSVVAGIIGGRAEHVIIHSSYFVEHPAEIAQVWLGGMEWHGAVLFGQVGLAFVCRLWKISFRSITDALAPILSVGAVLVFGGCWLSGYGYGREVGSLADVPRFVAAELPDMYGIVAPRLNTQLFGVIASLILFGVALLEARLIHRIGVQWWITLSLLATAIFALGALRGDPMLMIGTLRLDQVLDLSIAVIALGGVMFTLRQSPQTAGN